MVCRPAMPTYPIRSVRHAFKKSSYEAGMDRLGISIILSIHPFVGGSSRNPFFLWMCEASVYCLRFLIRRGSSRSLYRLVALRLRMLLMHADDGQRPCVSYTYTPDHRILRSIDIEFSVCTGQ